MEIWVILNSNGELKTHPERAKVKVGSAVHWRFQAENIQTDELVWVVYFGSRVPFSGVNDIASHSVRDRNYQHISHTSAHIAQQEGKDYKYGIKVINYQSGEQVADEDPYLDVVAVE